ncbi:DUF2339 domain-containing protein, partial [Sinorhizobium fredii]|uniref:DUF2339 domain-containing protein n=1 Tax=Rhizobium fredii TaxID=380 RepID=UPI0005676FDD
MLELIALVAFAMALAAFLSGRRNADRLDAEIESLKAEIARLATRAAEDVPDHAASARTETEAPTSPEIEEEAVQGPWSQAREGARIFGSAPAAAEDAETTASGEPADVEAAEAVAARSAESLESRIGGRWPVWVGGLALALGGYFLVQYSIEAGLLSPAVRLTLAAIFGLALGMAGEVIRRRAVPTIADRFRNAMIPGVLTAAGAVTLFGVVYAAHG